MLVAALTLASCAQRIDTGETLPQPNGPLPVLARPTEVDVSAVFTLAQLERICNEEIPGNGPVDAPLKYGIRLKGAWSRGAITVRPAPPGFRLELAQVHADGGTPVHWSADATASAFARPVVDTSYNIHTGANMDLHFNDAVIRALFTLHIGGLLNQHLSGALNGRVGSLDARLNHKLKLRERAAALWAAGFGVQKIDARNLGQPLYVLHAPTRLKLANPVVTADGRVRFGLGLAGNVQMVAGDQAPPPPAATALPAVTLVPRIDGGFSIDLPLVIKPAALGPAISGAIAAGKIKPDLGLMKLQQVEFGGVDTHLLARLSLQSGRYWGLVDGRVLVQLDPYVDPDSHTLGFRNIRFTPQTQQFFARAAYQLFVAPVLALQMEQKLKLSLAPQEAAARDALNRLSADLKERSHGLAGMNVQQVKLAAVSMQSGYLVLEVTATGQVTASLDAQAGLLGD